MRWLSASGFSATADPNMASSSPRGEGAKSQWGRLYLVHVQCGVHAMLQQGSVARSSSSGFSATADPRMASSRPTVQGVEAMTGWGSIRQAVGNMQQQRARHAATRTVGMQWCHAGHAVMRLAQLQVGSMA